LKVGDRVRVTQIPPILPEDDTRSLFGLCLGRVFPIVGFKWNLLELEVGEVLGKPAYADSIWIEPEFVEIVETN